MNQTSYETWVQLYVNVRDGFVRGCCATACAELAETFPELRRAAGFVHVEWGREEHHWCVAPDGRVVDPTVAQYAPLGVFEYEELDLSNPADIARIPTGKCMECGGPIYGDRKYTCSPRCEVELQKSFED